MNDSAAIALSLISHTNAGKTTLARTLLGRDVGEVRDSPHVTTEATAYPLLATEEGDTLALWDTPGFGDSARLARRLAQQGNPITWFLAQAWDRWRDRTFWLTQQAVRNVREQADVVLYLVNAAENPADAGYLASELAVLEWIGKPVLVLLNQTGAPRAAAAEAKEIERWRAALASHSIVRGVLALDAFTRCWVQEFGLFTAIGPLVVPDRRSAWRRLALAWRTRRWAQFDQAMAALAAPIAAAVCARIVLRPKAMLHKLGTALGVAGEDDRREQAAALRELAERLDDDLRAATDGLIGIHGLEGRAAAEVEARLATDMANDRPVAEGKAAAVGGIVSGAMTGLAADLAAGGLTLGAGLLTGAILGALGGAGVARVVNVVRGRTEEAVRWDDAFLDRLATASLLRYLAVAHFGRGRGDWKESEYPAFWREQAAAAVAARRADFSSLWSLRGPPCDAARVDGQLQALLAQTARALLLELYPDAMRDTA